MDVEGYVKNYICKIGGYKVYGIKKVKEILDDYSIIMVVGKKQHEYSQRGELDLKLIECGMHQLYSGYECSVFSNPPMSKTYFSDRILSTRANKIPFFRPCNDLCDELNLSICLQ